MRILVLHLGGTIACTMSDGVLKPSADITPYFKKIAKEFKNVSFAHRHPSTFLGEYLNASYINLALKEVKKASESKKYDGIIITHGSDTVAYTACALAYALGNDCIPTVAVCAELPISDSASSAHINLRAAVGLICAQTERGVFSVYKADAGSAYVLRATRLLRYKTYESELSCTGEHYGKVSFIAPTAWIFTKNPLYKELNDELPPLDFKLSKSNPVSVIQMYPSMVCTRPSRSCRAVILSTYHSGTLDTKNPSLRKLCAYCKRKSIPVYADGIGTGADYESMNSFAELEIKRLPAKASPIAMHMKLWALLSCGAEPDAIELSLGGDIF